MTRRHRGSGYYQLRSGLVIHLVADKVPTADALEALDDVATAAMHWLAICRLRNALIAVATGSETYRANCIGRGPQR